MQLGEYPAELLGLPQSYALFMLVTQDFFHEERNMSCAQSYQYQAIRFTVTGNDIFQVHFPQKYLVSTRDYDPSQIIFS